LEAGSREEGGGKNRGGKRRREEEEERRRRREEGGGRVRTVRRGEGGKMCTPREGVVSLTRVTIYITFINIYPCQKISKKIVQVPKQALKGLTIPNS
jgi:hypothetical protein